MTRRSLRLICVLTAMWSVAAMAPRCEPTHTIGAGVAWGLYILSMVILLLEFVTDED